MSLHVETLNTLNMSVELIVDPSEDQAERLYLDDLDPVLVLWYDEAIVITGDLRKFADMVNRAVAQLEMEVSA